MSDPVTTAAEELRDACEDEGVTDLIDGAEVDATLKTRRLAAALGIDVSDRAVFEQRNKEPSK